ncbi:hypothetical protein MBLNU457_3344t2 [Dothideomycetes sp. NU457]
MASFFQPDGLISHEDNNTRFQIYYNAPLAQQNLTRYWWQDLVKTQDQPPIDKAQARSHVATRLETVTTFEVCELILSASPPRWRCDLLIVPLARPASLLIETQELKEITSSGNVDTRVKSWSPSTIVAPLEEPPSPTTPLELFTGILDAKPPDFPEAELRQGSVQLESAVKSNLRYGSFSLEADAPKSTTTLDAKVDAKLAYLRDLRTRQNMDGMVLELKSTNDAVTVRLVLKRFQYDGIPVLLLADPDLPVLDEIDLSLTNGIIVKNAAVLSTGKRRDFFRADRVRDLAARSKRQRKFRSDFLFAFLEMYDTLPSAATLRRAYKLADFFGAIITARPRCVDTESPPVTQMCLSGFDWLKKTDVVWLQKQWSTEASIGSSHTVGSVKGAISLALDKLEAVLPGSSHLLASHPLPLDLQAIRREPYTQSKTPDCRSPQNLSSSIWNSTISGDQICPVGCFALRDTISYHEYTEIVKNQRHLKELGMLHSCSAGELLNISSSIKKIAGRTAYESLVTELCTGLQEGRIQVHRGLDSGFTLPDDRGHAWGVCDVVGSNEASTMDIYLSQKNAKNSATIWHVFLSTQGVPREKRFEEELLFMSPDETFTLPASLRRELETDTETELLCLLRRLSLQDPKSALEDGLCALARHILLPETTKTAWSRLTSRACIDDSIPIERLLSMRLEHFSRQGADKLPLLTNLIEFYDKAEHAIEQALFWSDRNFLNKISAVLVEAYAASTSERPVDYTVDLCALVFFCIIKRAAFEDIYLETTDRCPLFLSQHDQAGVFSELWVLGSQCEIYFGILPRTLGEIIYDRYRKFLEAHPPPLSSWDGKNVFSAYSTSEPKIRIEGNTRMTGSGSPVELPGAEPGFCLNDPKSRMSLKEAAHKLGALSIFCFPAIIDVILLTFLGRGLYLTAFMDIQVRTMANYAILIALIMTGGITGWVGSSGGFYLFSYAFDNLTHFMVQRFSAAFVLTSVVAFCGGFAFSQQYSWYAGFIFVMYLFALTTFLNLLGVFATMHRPGSPLTSGRVAMWRCIPILFISPVVSTFVVGWDTLIYLLVIYAFVIALLVSFRSLCHEWTTWYDKVPTIKEKDLFLWYTQKLVQSGSEKVEESASTAALAREALQFEVSKFVEPRWWRFWDRKQRDPFVAKMAVGHKLAMWLLNKEAYGASLPETYTTTWFVQLELAFANQKHLVRGLKEHSQFILFRYSKYDIGQNVGLFLAALMDRWVDIVMSAKMPHNTRYLTPRARYSVCFGLLYFLMGAVAVDSVLQRHWAAASSMSTTKMASLNNYKQVLGHQNRQRKQEMRQALGEFVTLLLLIFGFCTIFEWFLVDDHINIILYFCYILGYTGVLFFQFNRPFTKNIRWHVLIIFISCAVAFVAGCSLRGAPAMTGFKYDFVIALDIAAVPSAIGTFLLTGYFEFPSRLPVSSKSSEAERQMSDAERALISAAPSGVVTPRPPAFDDPDTDNSNLTSASMGLLKDLCLSVNVNQRWTDLPEDVRQWIYDRVIGQDAKVSPSALTWLVNEGVNLRHNSERLERRALIIQDMIRQSENRIEERHTRRNSSKADTADLSLAVSTPKARKNLLTRFGIWTIRTTHSAVKWIALLSGGAPDCGRELWFASRNQPLHVFTLRVLLFIWKLCWWMQHFWAYVFLVAGSKRIEPLVRQVHLGSTRKLSQTTIIFETPAATISGILGRDAENKLSITSYEGQHTEAPQDKKYLAKAYYDNRYRLQRRIVAAEGSELVTSEYHYADESSRWPASKTVFENNRESICHYDKYGRILRGRVNRAGKMYNFVYWYRKRPKGNADVLQASYQDATDSSNFSIDVFYCIKPRNKLNNVQFWVPSEKLQRIVCTHDKQVYEMTWTYKHARHPDIETCILKPDGEKKSAVAPPLVQEAAKLFLKRPSHNAFDEEDLLIYHSVRWLKSVGYASTRGSSGITEKKERWSFSPSLILSRSKTVYRKLPTSILRTSLWKAWEQGPFLDAVSACSLDEMILRKEPLLHRYWRFRDSGRLKEAADELDENLEQIVCAIEPSAEASQKCPLLIKASDLFSMGLGKDANQLTARLENAYEDSAKQTSVIFSDNGCWPDNPGGVSNCRRDLINGHTTIRGHCLAESANDYGIPRYQIEQNVNSLKILPLWGLDGKTPYHGLLDNLLQTQIDERIEQTRIKEDIEEIFVPLLRAFVKGARSRRYTRDDIATYSNVILRMNGFFERCDFNKTWTNELVWEAWMKAWLIEYDDPNISSPANLLEIERPSMNDFRDALNLYICYFFIYSVEVPGKCPTVFQTTHHGISSLYGVLLKFRRQTTWGVWDHAILWRETCLNISPAQCLLPIPVQAMLLAGVKLACHVAYTHTDIVLPCTSVFNPDWEQDLGTDQGLRGSKKLFARKIDPIVNGIGNMDAFQPVTEVRSKVPTTVMLSNVQFIKDVKTAVLAADVIINKFGFSDYRLLVYGAQDRQPSYALETTMLINARNMAGKVVLAGFGSPKEVLKDAWLFMNSSLSEGLPLAIGEAALSGIPIVATEVGATALVLTDPDDPSKRYGEVVPPNDPEALARAQLSILAMLGPWAQYTHDDVPPPALPDTFSPLDVEWITKRMYDKTADRQALGLKLRDVVLRSFHGSRYLREHEQMYWIQRKWAESRRAFKGKVPRSVNSYFGDKTVFTYDRETEARFGTRPRWQTFDIEEVRRERNVEGEEKTAVV